jgi:hypothetical protein
MEPLKKQGLVKPELVEQVSQVRRYRNWVAHGRRNRDMENDRVTPKMAFQRLKEFMDVLGISPERERN